jgi:F-type H+-transporting ATPase subunit b
VRTAVVTVTGGALRVELVSAESEEGKEFNPEESETPTSTECGPGPGPIIPEMKELAWGAGSFIVFALLMRVFLDPRLRKGMDARYNSIRDGHEAADAARASARSEVAQYEAAVSAAKADAAKVVDAARATLESTRRTPASRPSATRLWPTPTPLVRRLAVRSRPRWPTW